MAQEGIATAVHAPITQSEFRRVLSRFASGITVITAPGARDPDYGPSGFTCQSFSSLSLDPPLVVFLVGRTSRSCSRISRAGVFCVNILSAGQSRLCRTFAYSGTDKFAEVTWEPSPVTGSPMLVGALAWIDCSVYDIHPGGDHLIVVGRVNHLAADPDGKPLVRYQGAFGTFAD